MGFDWDEVLGAVLALFFGLAVVLAFGGIVYSIATTPVCYAIEPDGERETLTCPEGWQDGETRHVQEDEFERYEWDD